jgi:hypothetical protein
MTDPERDVFDVRPSANEMVERVRAGETEGRGRLRIYRLTRASGLVGPSQMGRRSLAPAPPAPG